MVPDVGTHDFAVEIGPEVELHVECVVQGLRCRPPHGGIGEDFAP
jgi:hypothetical protein